MDQNGVGNAGAREGRCFMDVGGEFLPPLSHPPLPDNTAPIPMLRANARAIPTKIMNGNFSCCTDPTSLHSSSGGGSCGLLLVAVAVAVAVTVTVTVAALPIAVAISASSEIGGCTIVVDGCMLESKRGTRSSTVDMPRGWFANLR